MDAAASFAMTEFGEIIDLAILADIRSESKETKHKMDLQKYKKLRINLQKKMIEHDRF